MKVFISWSGARSHDVAEPLSEWLRCVLQAFHLGYRRKTNASGQACQPDGSVNFTDVGVTALTFDNLTLDPGAGTLKISGKMTRSTDAGSKVFCFTMDGKVKE